MEQRVRSILAAMAALCICSLAQAEPVDVNNFSFELDGDGNQILGHVVAGRGAGLMGWTNEGDWIGADVPCCNAVTTPNHCQAWPATDGIAYCYIQNKEINIYQVLDHNIGPHQRYRLTFDGLGWNHNVIASLFYAAAAGEDTHVELTSETYLLAPSPVVKEGPCANPLGSKPTWNWTRDLMVPFTTQAGGDYVGQPLGIKFASSVSDNKYIFVDNVRMDCVLSTYAWDPSPSDGQAGVPAEVTLRWKAGTHTQGTAGHHVYFGTSFPRVEDANTSTVGIYRGERDVNNYPVTERLDSGRTYYWRVDEINDAYTAGWQPGDTPPAGPWRGDVWSFTVRIAGDFVYPDGVDFIDYAFFAEHWLETDYGDVNGVELSGDGKINWEDFGLFAGWWRVGACGACGGADFTGDGNVDYLDLDVFTRYWLESDYGDCSGAELTSDGVVGLDDLRRFCASWLEGIN
jgi:hypothetical protein